MASRCSTWPTKKIRAPQVDMNYVLTGANKFIEIQATAEHEPFSDEQLAQMTALARKGIAELAARQREVLSAAGIKL